MAGILMTISIAFILLVAGSGCEANEGLPDVVTQVSSEEVEHSADMTTELQRVSIP